MKGGAVARRYAKALIDLARRDGVVAEIGVQLQQHQGLLHANPQLQKVLDNPSVNTQAKIRLMTTILDRTQPLPLLRNFVLLLVDRDRLRQLAAITMHYEQMANAELHRIVAQVTSAVALTPQQRQALIQKIAAATQRNVELETQVDPAILGGLVVRVNNVIVDGSIRGQLARMHKALREG